MAIGMIGNSTGMMQMVDRMDGPMMAMIAQMGMHGMGMGVMMWLMLLGLLLFGLLLVAIIVLVIRSAAGNRGRDVDRAEDVLRERFARGEIDREEYLDRLETLRTG